MVLSLFPEGRSSKSLCLRWDRVKDDLACTLSGPGGLQLISGGDFAADDLG